MAGARRRRGREIVELAAFRLGMGVLATLPEGAAMALGRGLGGAAYRLLKRRRETALGNLARVFPERSPAARTALARGSFESLGLLVADFARLPRRDRGWVERHVVYEGWERYLEASARGRGVLYLAAHFGSWEVIPHAQALLGRPMAYIVRPADNPRIESIIRATRERCGNAVIAKKEALRECLRRLRLQQTVGVLIDQHVPADRGVPGRFLGQPVYTTSVLAALAQRTGAPVLPAFAFREGPDRHRIVLGPEVEIARSGDRVRDLIENVERCNRVVESCVRAQPDHWLWSHRRFRDAAAGDEGLRRLHDLEESRLEGAEPLLGDDD